MGIPLKLYTAFGMGVKIKYHKKTVMTGRVALENMAQHIAVAEAAVPVLGERRVVGHLVVEVEPAEPTEGQPVFDLLAQPRSERMP
jgi:hypothetical protein